MGNQFLGEIRLFGGSFAPQGWALCQGQLLPVAQNTALFSLLGTQFGGDGRATFGLPNLVGNAAVCAGQGGGLSQYTPGQVGGVANVTLNSQQIAAHIHSLEADTLPSNTSQPGGNYFGAGPVRNTHLYADGNATTPMANNIVSLGGGGQPHPNQQPYLVLTFIIALTGIFPPRP